MRNLEKKSFENIMTVTLQGIRVATKLKNSLHATTGSPTSLQMSGNMLTVVKPVREQNHDEENHIIL